jgi:3'-5' exoribonuclease
MRVDDGEVKFADFFPASSRDSSEMFAELRGIIDGIGNPYLKALLDAIFADERIARAYPIAPAAKQIHHAYLGGLIEHVLSLAKLARVTGEHYRDIDIDLLLTGVILHDLGKIDELTYDRGFGYSTEGQLIGHIMIGFRIIEEKLRGIANFPPTLHTLLQHMILSHHGELAYGSPKVPLFPEALLLHHLDNLDSKMECMRSLVEKDRQFDGCWTSYSSSLERAVLKKRKFLEQREDITPAPAIAPSHPAPDAPIPANIDRSTGLFGDKLKQALNT